MDDSQKKFFQILGVAAGAYVAYRILKGDTVEKAITAPIKTIIDAGEETGKQIKKTVKKLVKGSPEAKAHMDKLRSVRKSKKSKSEKKKNKAVTDTEIIKKYSLKGKAKEDVLNGVVVEDKKEDHKGHKTKKGLSQDQKLVSKEKHEKNYRKTKSKKMNMFSEKEIKIIAENTDKNFHTENWVFIAEKIGEENLKKNILENSKKLEEGNTTADLANQRYKNYKSLMSRLKKKVSLKEYKEIYSRL